MDKLTLEERIAKLEEMVTDHKQLFAFLMQSIDRIDENIAAIGDYFGQEDG